MPERSADATPALNSRSSAAVSELVPLSWLQRRHRVCTSWMVSRCLSRHRRNPRSIVYAHLTPAMLDRAAERMDALLSA